MEALVALPGVGRKTANVVLGNAFGKDEGFVVDTHVGRLSRRLGFTRQTDPVKIELDLNALVPKGRRTLGAHLLISHGRAICAARKPLLRRVPGRGGCARKSACRSAESSRPLSGNQFSEGAAENPVNNPAERAQKTRNLAVRRAKCTVLCAIEQAPCHQQFTHNAQARVQSARGRETGGRPISTRATGSNCET